MDHFRRDHGGWNNVSRELSLLGFLVHINVYLNHYTLAPLTLLQIRMAMETALVMSHAMGRCVQK